MKTTKYYKLKDLPFSKKYFWSYDFDRTELPLSKIIEHLIRYGRFADHINLFKFFTYSELEKAYYNEIRPVMSGEKYFRSYIPTKMDMKNINYMDFLFEVFKNVAA